MGMLGIPRRPEGAAGQTEQARRSDAGISLVICDDHVLFAQPLAELLGQHGFYVVACTATPETAMEVLESRDVDICLMDLSFKGDSRVDAIEKMSTYPPTRVVILTGALEVDAAAAVRAGAMGFCHKSDTIAEVAQVLRRVHNGELVLPVGLLHHLVAERTRNTPASACGITPRELEILQALAQGQSGHAIATQLGIQYATVRTHVQNILVKLGAHTQLEAVAVAISKRIVSPPDQY